VLETRRLTPPHRPPRNDTWHVVISSPGLRYLPGQSVGIVPPGIDARTGKPHKHRLFSVASDSDGDYGDGQTLSLVIVRHFWDNTQTGERDIPGVCSNYLCDIPVGAEVKITGPTGKRFLLPEPLDGRDLIFMATSTGIAPYRAMLKRLFHKNNYPGRVWLYFGTQYEDLLLYNDEFLALTSRSNFRYITATSRETQNPFPDTVPTPGNRMYVQSRLWENREEMAESLRKPDTLLYVCGIKGMDKGVASVVDLIAQQAGLGDSYSQQMKEEGRLLTEVY
jgi:ferredoxin--NADP+ reductase